MDLTVFEAVFGISIEVSTAFIILGMASVALGKDTFGLKGNWIYLAVAILQAILNSVAYLGQWQAIVVGTLICFIGSTGIWAGAKQLIEKGKTT